MSTYNEMMLENDPYNFDNELKYRLFHNDINREDLINFLSDGFIDTKQFIELVEYCDYLDDIDSNEDYLTEHWLFRKDK